MQAAALEDWDDAWKDDAVATIVDLSLKLESFSADDLRPAIRPPNRSAQYGAAFTSAQKKGLIVPIESHKSSSKSRNHGRNLRWTRKQEGVGK